jgi:hypothetical protein
MSSALMQSQSKLIFDRSPKAIPSEKDKHYVFQQIAKLSKEEHIYIFKLLQELSKKIYTISDTETLFDLNDVSSDLFWKIYDYIVLSIENKSREQEKERIRAEYDQQQSEFVHSFDRKIDVNAGNGVGIRNPSPPSLNSFHQDLAPFTNDPPQKRIQFKLK